MKQDTVTNNISGNYQFNHDLDIFDEEDEEGLKQYMRQIFLDIANTNKEEQMANYNENQSNKNGEVNKKKNNEVQINQNFVMKQAYLKETNMDKIKKFELDYFQEFYGNYFKDFH